MCRVREAQTRMVRPESPQSPGSKIKGRGTSAPLTACLHIGFGGTRAWSSVSLGRVTRRNHSDSGVPSTPEHAAL